MSVHRSLSTRKVAAIAGFTLALALATPGLATAQSSHTHVGSDNRAGTPLVHGITPSVGATGSSVRVNPDKKLSFPSASSTVIASTGFIDGEQIGYFWSASRGDSVEQTFSGPKKVGKAVFKLDVPYNGLTSGIEVDWTASINGKDIGSFVVPSGVTGPVTAKMKFKKLHGGTYDVKIRVTNEVPAGDGSITLRYAGSGPHSLTLKK